METRPDSVYTTPKLILDQLHKANTGEDETTEEKFDEDWDLIRRYCWAYSEMIESQTNCTFAPYYATKNKYFGTEIRVGNFAYQQDTGIYRLDLWEDLLGIDSITWDGTALTDDEYRLVGENNSADTYPYARILFDASEVPDYDTDFDTAIVIAGEWGVHDNPTSAYTDATEITAAIADTTSTSVTILNGEYTLFQIYQYIKIDDELMFITDISVGGPTDTLTVVRGANGYTAATHDNGSTISRWNVVYDVQELGTRMCAYFYGKRDDTGEMINFLPDGSVIFAQFSRELNAIVRRRRRSLMGVS
jgi:hypothetical protein